jgi:hypothetical protein
MGVACGSLEKAFFSEPGVAAILGQREFVKYERSSLDARSHQQLLTDLCYLSQAGTHFFIPVAGLHGILNRYGERGAVRSP